MDLFHPYTPDRAIKSSDSCICFGITANQINRSLKPRVCSLDTSGRADEMVACTFEPS